MDQSYLTFEKYSRMPQLLRNVNYIVKVDEYVMCLRTYCMWA